MRCKYGTGSEAIWLTGLPWQEDVAPIRWQGQQAAQATPLVGADSPKIRSFGNAVDQLPVSIVLQFDTELDAVKFCAQILWDLPKSGELTFVDQAGTNQVTITYPQAAFQNAARMREGRAVRLDYTFLVSGPPSVTVVSDAPLRIESESGTPITTES
jgi:hypothetical protein